MTIPIARPYFDDDDRAALVRALDSGWVVQGPGVREFEDLFAKFVGAPYAAATTSCTTALHLSLMALGIGPGDEVVLPAFTFVASANVIEHAGARPRFCDIDLATYNIDPSAMEAAVTPSTRALLPVHLFGLPAPMDAALDTARRHGLRVLEDAACAIGSRLRGAHVGALGDAGCFSFHPRKALTTGEGGMIATRDASLAARVRRLRDHGAAVTDAARHAGGGVLLPDFDEIGYNYRMTDFQGWLGASQMRKASQVLERRRSLARGYSERLGNVPWLRLPLVPEGMEHGWQAYVTLVVGDAAPDEPRLSDVDRLHAARNRIMERLQAKGIASRQGTHAVHALGAYRARYGLRPEDFPRAWIADRLTLALPLYARLTEDEQDEVAAALIREGRAALGGVT